MSFAHVELDDISSCLYLYHELLGVSTLPLLHCHLRGSGPHEANRQPRSLKVQSKPIATSSRQPCEAYAPCIPRGGRSMTMAIRGDRRGLRRVEFISLGLGCSESIRGPLQ